jgi:D-alanyl-lipoteichoic acid acyltransferase DltB (MBOAT superfamily)
MVFNSVAFLGFFPAFLAAYLVTRGNARLLVCLGASYIFYAFWDPRFTGLLFMSTTVDFWLGRALGRERPPATRRALLIASLLVNLGTLAAFKYFDFFADTFGLAYAALGGGRSDHALRVILPIGISFYTFHSLAYTIDVYRRDISPEPSFLRYATFVAFFPHLVAGPILRAKAFLPQLRTDHAITRARFDIGVALVVWGYFKKLVVADNLAAIVDPRFASPEAHGALSLALGAIGFAFQIYADFSGYSDIAIGLAYLLGFDFPRNFARPYFATSFSEFWRRWHISLSTWLRDYLYIPLGGNRDGVVRTCRNILITMILGGLWHGGSWTFVLWGALHGGFLVIERLLGSTRTIPEYWRRIPSFVRYPLASGVVFTLTVATFVLFRSPSVEHAVTYWSRIVTAEGWAFAAVDQKFLVIKSALAVAVLVLGDAIAEVVNVEPLMLRYRPVYILPIAVGAWSIALFGAFEGAQFLYFQF